MELRKKFPMGLLLAGALVSSALAQETIQLRRGLVVPVRFQDELSLRENRRGDRFTAVVQGDRDLPDRTVLQGHIADLRRAEGRQPGYMDLEFDSLVLPDGTRYDVQAVPIRMDDKSVRRGSDGRFTAKKKLEDTSKYVVGGMVGGYLIGRILGDKHAEGLMLGALAGILMGESERNSSSNEVVVKRDAKMGALFEREVTVEVRDGRFDPRDANGRYDERRDDRYNPFDPRNRDERRASDRDELVAEFDGRELRWGRDEQPYREGEIWMVPLESTARQVGLAVDATHSRRIYVEDDDTVLILEQDSRNYRLNGKRDELPRSIAVRDDLIYVPFDVILAAKSGQIRIIGTQTQRTT